MAKHEYKRGYRVEKPCAQCGTLMYLVPSWAESRLYCSPECKAGKETRPCDVCSSPVLSRIRNETPAKYCSRSCASIGQARIKGFTIKAREACCANCYSYFRPNPRTSNIGKYCSRSCAYAHKSETAKIVAWIKSLGSENRARRQAWEIANRRPPYVFQGPVRPIVGSGSIGKCIECKAQYVRSRDRQRLCSVACEEVVAERVRQNNKQARKEYRKTSKARAHKKLYKTLRRRRELTVFEAIDPIEVFERDNWTCQICRIKTPRSRRGSIKPNAPELDHILPLALGGPHTWANLQCACRSCNLRKGAKPLGQMLLDMAV